jgi:hypothetical protein
MMLFLSSAVSTGDKVFHCCGCNWRLNMPAENGRLFSRPIQIIYNSPKINEIYHINTTAESKDISTGLSFQLRGNFPIPYPEPNNR